MTTIGDLILAYADEPPRVSQEVVADFYEEQGFVEMAARWRREIFPIVRDINLPFILEDYDWLNVFGLHATGQTKNECEPCPPQATHIDLAPPQLTDVAFVLATVNGENDTDPWIGVFKLKDGRWLAADAWCDYTGWD